MKPTESAVSPDQRLVKSVEIGTLCAFYGSLLTAKQRSALLLHYEEDLSLGEIAEQYGVSRQNVHELITRSAQKLERYEQALGGVAKARGMLDQLRRAQALIQDARAEPASAQDALAQAHALLEQMICQQEGEENDHGL
ncbi:MAG: sigma factor-like helix-turn-helix DNA-binding protein [Clostridia bacterium]